MKVAVVTGTRPELIKMQPIIKEIQRRDDLKLIFLHTGQHYDWNMSNFFIKELELPKPNFFLNVKSGSHGVQTARTITNCERVLKTEKPDIVLIEGDTNSALGTALAAAKIKIPVGHVEAGCRSFDKSMPEEINRILIADLASIHFAPTKTCVQNLVEESIPKEQIYHTGHPIVDMLHQFQSKVNQRIIDKFGLKAKKYYLVTIHREENVDDKGKLEGMLEALSRLAKSRSVIFPVHPHTSKCIKRFGFEKYLKNLKIVHPVGYLEALSLIKYARIVLTDSGGIQQEGALLETPCITLRSNTEWIETVNYGVNFLTRSGEDITVLAKKVENEYEKIKNKFGPLKKAFGELYVSVKIVDIIEKLHVK